jgi:hypothetical protein
VIFVDIGIVDHQLSCNRIGGVMVSVLASSVVDREFESWSGQTKDYKTGICYFSAKHVNNSTNINQES